MTLPARTTSALALAKLRRPGVLSSVRLRVYEALYEHGPMTGRELDHHLARPGETRTSYHKRLPELLSAALVRVVGTRRCRVSGEVASAWDVTDLAPDGDGPVYCSARKLDLVGVRYELEAERAALTYALEMVRQAADALAKEPAASARQVGAYLCLHGLRLHESRAAWTQRNGAYPIGRMVPLSRCSSCGLDGLYKGDCYYCQSVLVPPLPPQGGDDLDLDAALNPRPEDVALLARLASPGNDTE